jgi:CHASE3 domain sensor protein
MKYMIENKIKYVLLVAALIFIFTLVVFYYNSKNTLLTSRLVEHTQDVLRKSNEVLIDIIDMETGTRGYLLSRDPSFLEPYRDAKKTINSNLTDLEDLTIENKEQHARILSLNHKIISRLQIAKAIIDGWSGFSTKEKIKDTRKRKDFYR